MELPHVNVLSKCDLLGERERRRLDGFLDVDAGAVRQLLDADTSPAFFRLNSAVCGLLEEWSLVQFLQLDVDDEASIDEIVAQVDNVLQYYDDAEPRMPEAGDVDEDVQEGAGFGGSDR